MPPHSQQGVAAVHFWASGRLVLALVGSWLLFAACVAVASQDSLSPEQPYAYLAGGALSGPRIMESPDPLVAYRWSDPKVGDALQVHGLRPKAAVGEPREAFANVKSLTEVNPYVTVTGNGSLRLDLGVECAAWIEFDSSDCSAKVTMSVSEYNEPGVDKTREPKRYGNTYRLELNDELYEGVRFAWIHVQQCGQPWHITGIRAICQVKPTNYEGSFSCSDPQLTRAWYASAYGVKVALCKDYFGSILMDRGDRMSWTGDAHPAQAAALVAFGNRDFVAKNLENTSKQDNGIRSYSLYWVLSLLDYYRYSGDEANLRHHLANACAKLDAAWADFGKELPLRFYGWDERLCAGFEIWFRSCPEAQRAYRMLAIRSWREFAVAMQGIGRSDLAGRYLGYAQAKIAELTKEVAWHARYGVHAAADAVNTGLLDALAEEAIFQQELSDRVNRLSLSPFNEYFILQAMAKIGRYDEALCTVRDMWGGMLECGGTTTFEVYRPSWNQILAPNDAVPNTQCGIVSLCHPWGAGVVLWLSEQVLGIVPTAPGFATYELRPHLGTTLTRVSGSTPTPHGVIEASLDLDTGRGRLKAPQQTVGRLCVPKAGRTIVRIFVRGELAWDGAYHSVAGIRGASEDLDYVAFDGVAPGEYPFAVEYRGSVSPAVPAEFSYAALVLPQDTVTGGDWGGVYGRDGHVLCSAGPNGADQLALPAYVRSVDFYRAFPHSGRPDNTVWAASTADRRALAHSADNGVPRTAAAVSNNDQTMTATIRVDAGTKYRVAFYLVDWQNDGQRAAVELFDADTLRMIAPVQMARGQGNGVYLCYECDRSVKVRFDKVRGKLVTLSGIFFDPVMR
jgi:hypothetical protein